MSASVKLPAPPAHVGLIPTRHASQLIGVTVARLHQMIHEGKITPEARAECCGSYMFHPDEIARIQKERLTK